MFKKTDSLVFHWNYTDFNINVHHEQSENDLKWSMSVYYFFFFADVCSTHSGLPGESSWLLLASSWIVTICLLLSNPSPKNGSSFQVGQKLIVAQSGTWWILASLWKQTATARGKVQKNDMESDVLCFAIPSGKLWKNRIFQTRLWCFSHQVFLANAGRGRVRCKFKLNA